MSASCLRNSSYRRLTARDRARLCALIKSSVVLMLRALGELPATGLPCEQGSSTSARTQYLPAIAR